MDFCPLQNGMRWRRFNQPDMREKIREYISELDTEIDRLESDLEKQMTDNVEACQVTATRLQKIDNIGYILEEVLQDEECFSLKDLAVNGRDLITIGYKPGKEIGEVLNNLLDSVISGENINEKEKLLEIAERRLHG